MLRKNTLFRYISAFRSSVTVLKTMHCLKHLRHGRSLNCCVPLGDLGCGPCSMLSTVFGFVVCLVTMVLPMFTALFTGSALLRLSIPVPLWLDIDIPTTVMRTTVFI